MAEGCFTIMKVGVLIFVLVFGTLYGLPLLSVFSGANFVAFTDPFTWSVLIFSLQQSLLSVIISAAVGLPLGIWLGCRPQRAGFGIPLLGFPMAVPSLIAVTAWLSIGLPYSFWSIVLVHSFFNIPLVALAVSQQRIQIPKAFIETARTLGAKPSQVFLKVIWPAIKNAWLCSLAIVFNLCMMSFAIVLILGGGPPRESLETSIYSELKWNPENTSRLFVLALLQFLVCLIPWIFVIRTREFFKAIQEAPLLTFRSRWRFEDFVCLSICASFSLFYFIPSFELSTWRALGEPSTITKIFSSTIHSVSLGLPVAGVTTALASVLIFLNRSRPQLFFWMLIPGGISPLVLGLGIWNLYSDTNIPAFILIGLLQSSFFLPFALRWLWPHLQSNQDPLIHTARSLGASPWQAFFKVEWPRIRAPIFLVIGIVFALSLGEVGSLMVFSSDGFLPLSLQIERWLGRYQFAEAAAGSFVLLILAFLSLASLGWRRKC